MSARCPRRLRYARSLCQPLSARATRKTRLRFHLLQLVIWPDSAETLSKRSGVGPTRPPCVLRTEQGVGHRLAPTQSEEATEQGVALPNGW